MPSNLGMRQTLMFLWTPEGQDGVTHLIGQGGHILDLVPTSKSDGHPLLIGDILGELDLLPLG